MKKKKIIVFCNLFSFMYLKDDTSFGFCLMLKNKRINERKLLK